MIDIGLDLPKSKIVNNLNQSSKALKQIGLPAIISQLLRWEVLGAVLLSLKKNSLK